MTKPPSPTRLKRKEYQDEDLSDIPEFISKPKRAFGARGQYRGRVGIDELAQIVGSKRYRNIKRSGNFMPGQFELWNARETGGNGKYWGGYQDADHDGLAHEFVVRRNDENGPMIAVNGYTTGRSDWIARKAFFEKYPNRADRKDKTPKSFMQEEFYAPERDKYGRVIKWAIEPGSDKDPYHYRQYEQYNRYIPPKKISPFNVFRTYITMVAINKYLASIGITMKEFVKQNGVGVLSSMNSDLYYYMVKGPIKAKLQEGADGQSLYHELEQQFIEGKQDPEYNAEAPTFEVDFEKWLFNKKDVKNLVKRWVRQLIDGGDTTIETATNLVKEMLKESNDDDLEI